MITRATMGAYLAVMLAELATEAEIDLADTPEGIGYALDQALADLGSDTANTGAGYALAEYYGLRRVRFALAARIDFDATAIQSKRSQLYNQIDSLIADAARRAASAGHPISSEAGAPAASVTAWPTDWIEPEASA